MGPRFTHNEDIICIVFASCSIIASTLLLFLLCCKRRPWWTTPAYSVVLMALGDFFLALVVLLACSRALLREDRIQEGDSYCVMTFVMLCLGNTTILWFGAMSVDLYLMLRGWKDERLLIWRPVCCVVVGVLLLIATVVPLVTHDLHPIQDIDYCYLSGNRDAERWLVNVPRTIVLVWGVLLLFIIIRKVYRKELPEKNIIYKLISVFIIYELIWIPALVERYYNWFADATLWNLQMYSVACTGASNFGIWLILNPKYSSRRCQIHICDTGISPKSSGVICPLFCCLITFQSDQAAAKTNKTNNTSINFWNNDSYDDELLRPQRSEDSTAPLVWSERSHHDTDNGQQWTQTEPISS